MDISTLYIALVFLAPVALGLTLLAAMASDLDWSGFASAKAKATSTVERKIAIDRAQACNACYA